MLHNNLPPNSRVWIYQGNRKLTDAEVTAMRPLIQEFVEQWTYHKKGVAGWGDVLYNNFIVLMADEAEFTLGGCSIDSSTRFIRTLEEKFHAKLFDRVHIAYKLGNEVLLASAAEFKQLLKEGKVSEETIVFNNLVRTKAELESAWELPYKNSWLRNAETTTASFQPLL